MSRSRGRLLRAVAGVAAAALLAAGCSAGRPAGSAPAARPTPSASAHPGHASGGATPVRSAPLRPGERFVDLAMPAPYTPSAPYGVGTDDYRCFVLDPHLTQDAFITGLDVVPGTPAEVHHVILFRAPPDSLAAVRAKDAADPGQGWTCFGDTGVRTGSGAGGGLDDAPWLGAWAPGGREQVMARDVGVPLAKGSRVIMQVHYNLLAGPRPDISAARLRLAPASADLAPLRTVLLPAPVELPCRPGRTGPLCSRAAALADVQKRFGVQAGSVADYLHLLCGPIRPGPVQTCSRTMRQPGTIRAVAGHMHLLGRSIRVDVNPGRPGARTVLDTKVWNFDDQGARPVKPVHLRRGDTVSVTCRHDQRLRDLLPSFRGQPEKYVLWGEGTTDEMCLGILLMTRP